MSRKKKELVRLSVALKSARHNYYVIMDRVVSKRYSLYKKAHLERKRRYRLKQLKKRAPYQEMLFISFRCCNCKELNLKINYFWGFFLCVECLYNPFVISKILDLTKKQIQRLDPSVYDVLHELEEQTDLSEKRKKQRYPFLKKLREQKETLKVILEKRLRYFPQGFEFLK